MTVGFIGLGRMGSRMAANLVAAGFDTVVHNRTMGKATDFADAHGGTAAFTPKELAEQCDIIVTMLADGKALTDTYHGPDGVLAGLQPDALCVEMSTIGPDLLQQMAKHVQDTGGRVIDAPVSGSVAAAESAKLMIMAGGDAASVEQARPVLEAMGNPVDHVGPLGSGATMKLAVNSVVFSINQSVAEALVMAERSGVDREIAIDTFIRSAVGAPVVTYRRDWFTRPDEMPVSFTIDLAIKDLELITGHAEGVGTSLPVADEALTVMRDAAEAGFGERDMGDVSVYMREGAGDA